LETEKEFKVQAKVASKKQSCPKSVFKFVFGENLWTNEIITAV